jgi:predicted nucleotidyltransferase
MIPDHGITPQSYRLMIDAIAQHPEIESAILFGSRAKGTFRKGSDIDIAIKGNACTPDIALQLSARLNEELPIPYVVDIVHYDTLQHQELMEHIDRVGVPLYEKYKS